MSSGWITRYSETDGVPGTMRVGRWMAPGGMFAATDIAAYRSKFRHVPSPESGVSRSLVVRGFRDRNRFVNATASARIYPAVPSKCQQRALYVRAGETWHRRRGKGAAVAAGASFLIDSTKLNRVHRDRTDDQSL